jgi:hypothetical protein
VHRFDNKMFFVARNTFRTLAVYVDADARSVTGLCNDLVVQRQCQSERVEARAEVGTGCRHSDVARTGSET